MNQDGEDGFNMKIFGRTESGGLTIELWTILPLVFLFSLILTATKYSSLNTNLIMDSIFSLILGIYYFGNYSYKKLRGYNDKT
jgi:hypothetical protein